MSAADQAAQRLIESKPPATDRFTYLTIIDKSLSPEVLPALHEILQDVELTGDIGWDLVEMLIAVPGSDECLRTIARLGNPREVILKVLQVMDGLESGPAADKAFVTLCGMLGVLHARLQVKAPSRFLHTTLETVYHSYNAASPEATAAVIALIGSMSGQKRPPLSTRQSSTLLETPFRQGDSASGAPDPEADGSASPNAREDEAMKRLLQSFVTCVIEAYVNSNGLEWASRLLEFTYPERIVPGRATMMQAFKDEDELRARDALVGQLVVSRIASHAPLGFADSFAGGRRRPGSSAWRSCQPPSCPARADLQEPPVYRSRCAEARGDQAVDGRPCVSLGLLHLRRRRLRCRPAQTRHSHVS